MTAALFTIICMAVAFVLVLVSLFNIWRGDRILKKAADTRQDAQRTTP